MESAAGGRYTGDVITGAKRFAKLYLGYYLFPFSYAFDGLYQNCKPVHCHFDVTRLSTFYVLRTLHSFEYQS